MCCEMIFTIPINIILPHSYFTVLSDNNSLNFLTNTIKVIHLTLSKWAMFHKCLKFHLKCFNEFVKFVFNTIEQNQFPSGWNLAHRKSKRLFWKMRELSKKNLQCNWERVRENETETWECILCHQKSYWKENTTTTKKKKFDV